MSQNQPSNKNNLILFMVLAFAVVMVHGMIFPPPKKKPQEENKPAAAAKDDQGKKEVKDEEADKDDKVTGKDDDAGKDDKDDDKDTDTSKDAEVKSSTETDATSEEEATKEGEKTEEPESAEEKADKKTDKSVDASKEALPTDKPPKFITLGSADPKSPDAMLITFTDRGAAVVMAELNSPRYPQLMDDDGYLADRKGYMGRIVLSESTHGKGCPVDVVGKGTPAEKAGIKPGDLILMINDTKVTGTVSYFAAMEKTRPKKTIDVTVLRDSKELALKVVLTRPPVTVVRPEGDDPLSFLMTMSQIGDESLNAINKANRKKKEKREEDAEKSSFPKPRPEYIDQELPGLNLRTGSWTIISHNDTELVFECELPKHDLKLTKTYRLAESGKPEGKAAAYHLTLDLKVENIGEKKIEAAYQLDGPTGLPLEGWWYAYKVGYCWGAGLRDTIVSLDQNTPLMVSCSNISKNDLPDAWTEKSITYIGVDAQYFTCLLIPEKKSPEDIWLAASESIRVGPVYDDKERLTNVSCRLQSLMLELDPGKSVTHSYKIFAGPKAKDILQPYALDELIYYGWFDKIAKPMVMVLHFFHAIVRNYGLAIIMLTILVRGLMYPMSRKQALAAAKMAELQPEIKKLQEKYKKDLEARHRAQQDLFKKHNYKPLAGCLMLLIQFPIWIGLFSVLRVDIELRGSSLFGSWLRWCSNLSAPDMLIDWHTWMPDFITCGVGFFGLGPYFNLLPILAIGFTIMQQKLMMPPPADEAQAMQQKMMKYMMIFMGLIFFKWASGLCIYFATSSLWGVAERKLLPKHPAKEKPQKAAVSSAHRKKRK